MAVQLPNPMEEKGPLCIDEEFQLKTNRKRSKLCDNYTYESEFAIGRGGYGSVYKIFGKESTEIQKTYAMKVIGGLREHCATTRELSLFRETNHPNIMNLLKVFFSYSTNHICLIFKYAEFDLNMIINHYYHAKTNIPPRLIKSSLQQILLGVDYLHNNWIMHRDLKPENILVVGSGPELGCIKITDMGLARTFHSPLVPLAVIDRTVVTSWYRAPELFLEAQHYTKAIDMFSIGCIFGELLTLNYLFDCKVDENHDETVPYQPAQLKKMFSVLGYPMGRHWLLLKHMPRYRDMLNDINRHEFEGKNLEKYMSQYEIHAREFRFKLMQRMLLYNPAKRITCPQALLHTYFKNDPQPSSNIFEDLPDIPFKQRKYKETDVRRPGEPTLRQLFEDD